MKICVKCGAELDDAAKFCNKCGEKVEEAVEEIKLNPVEEIEEEGTVLLDEVTETVEDPVEETVEEIEEIAEIAEEAAEEVAVEEAVEEMTETPAETFDQEADKEVVEESFEETEPVAVEDKPEQILMQAEKALENAFGEVKEPVKEIKLAPVMSPEVKAAIEESNAKAAKKAQKIARDAEIKAEKIAKKAEKKAKKAGETTEQKTEKQRKITFLGVMSAIFLSIFLILNLGIIFVSCFGAGVSLSEIEKAEFNLDGEIYSIDSFVQMTSSFDDGEMMEFLEALTYSDRTVEVAVDGTIYAIELSQETVDMIREMLNEGKSLANGVIETIDDVKEILFIVFVSVLGYASIVALVCIVASITSLGKRRKAALVPAIILFVLGLTMLVACLICTFAPATFGVQAVEAIFALAPVPLFANLCAGAITLVGVLLFVIGITGKKKA